MCLATVYVTHDGTDEKVCSSITHMDAKGGTLVFTDLLGRRTQVQGTIYEMDFNGSHVYVKGSVLQPANA